MDILAFIISLVGAAAWIPAIINIFRKKHRRVSLSIVDYRIIEDAKIMDKNKKKELIKEFTDTICYNCPVYFACGEEVTACSDFEKFLKEKGYESIWQFVRS